MARSSRLSLTLTKAREPRGQSPVRATQVALGGAERGDQGGARIPTIQPARLGEGARRVGPRVLGVEHQADGDGGHVLRQVLACQRTCSLGHSDRRVKQAITEQLGKIPFAHTGYFTNESAERLAEKLAERAPGALDWVFFVSGGSEAIESALKMARQYFVERGESGRSRFITRRQSFHGNTLGALAAGGNRWRRAQFEPLLIETHRIEPCYEYRGRGIEETPDVYGFRVADEHWEPAPDRLDGLVNIFPETL